VYWSDSGDLLAIATDETFYVLRYNRAAHLEAVNAGTADPNEGVEDAFEVVAELSEKYPSVFNSSPNL
jgi:coatomer subunit beta'